MKRLLSASTIWALLTLTICFLAWPLQSVLADHIKDITPPATYYGQILPTANYTPLPGQPITARIGAADCGQAATQTFDDMVVYAIDVIADGPSGPTNCGAPGRSITFYIAEQVMLPVVAWGGSGTHALDLYANSLPVANDDDYLAVEDIPYIAIAPGVLVNDVDPDGIPLTAIQLTDVDRGALVFNPDGSFSYNPLLNDNGVVTFTYQVSDTLDGSAPATVTITITAVNDAPAGVNDSITTTEDISAAIFALSNDYDVDGPVLFVASAGSANHGTVTYSSDAITYTPAVDFNGSDGFVYMVSDGSLTDTALVTVTVFPSIDPPVANHDVISTYEGASVVVPVLANDSDPDGDPLAIAAVAQPQHGNALFNVQVITYTPGVDYAGMDTFSYTASDGALTGAAVVTITVFPVSDSPIANNDWFTTDEDRMLLAPVASGVLINDVDADGDVLTANLMSGATNGSLVLFPDGAFVYTPTLDYFGTDQFTYRVSDGIWESNIASVTLTIQALNDPPIANADVFTTSGSLIISAPGILENDTDVDSNILTVILISPTISGTLQLEVDGSFTYIPNPGFTGTDAFTYHAYDGSRTSNPVGVEIRVEDNPSVYRIYLPTVAKDV